MIPGARIAAAIEILEQAEVGPSPVDRVIAKYFRRRRYAGSKDRAEISRRVYEVVRRRIRLDWWLERAGAEVTPRARLIADLALSDSGSRQAVPFDQARLLFSTPAHGPGVLKEREVRVYHELTGQCLEPPDMPDGVRLECPVWADRPLRSTLGDRFETCLHALAAEASFDLRINPVIEGDRDSVAQELAKAGLETQPMELSPLGLRAKVRQRINGLKQYKIGAIEVQDEGAQLAALLVGAEPGMQVVDYCAGAGGKTLVLGAMMANKGRVLAMDVSANRLDRAAGRIGRARLHNVERRVIKGEDDRYLKRWSKRFDRVLVDAPCSGLGIWRRDPEARMREDEASLAELTALQDRILANAGRLTRPGGRLVYVTCSLLVEENEKRIYKFLERRDDYKLLEIRDVWRDTVSAIGGGTPPVSGTMLRLMPDEHGTDGFFVAVLERKLD